MSIVMKRGSKEYTCDEDGLNQWCQDTNALQPYVPKYSEKGGLVTLSVAGDNAVGNTRKEAIQRFFEHRGFGEKRA